MIDFLYHFCLYCQKVLVTFNYNCTMTHSDNIKLLAIWDKIKENAKRFGRITTRQVLLMYYVLKSKDTPLSDRVVIYSTLVYLFLPVSIISVKRHPIIGWFDEAASIYVASKTIRQNITPDMEYQADQTLDRWFSEFTPYEIVE